MISTDPSGQSPLIATIHPLTLTSLFVPDHSVPEIDLLKSDLMFFDAFACPIDIKECHELPPHFDSSLPLIHWLHEEGLLLDLVEIPGFSETLQSLDEPVPLSSILSPTHFPPYVRMSAVAARKHGYKAIPLFGEIAAFDQAFGDGSERAYRILLDSLPVIDHAKHSWDDIRFLRRETEMILFRTGLLSWLARVANELDAGKLDESALIDEIRQSISDHSSRIRGLQVRTRLATLQTLLPISASAAAAKMNLATPGAATLWGAALVINGAFTVWRSYLDLHEAECQPSLVGYLRRLANHGGRETLATGGLTPADRTDGKRRRRSSV